MYICRRHNVSIARLGSCIAISVLHVMSNVCHLFGPQVPRKLQAHMISITAE